VAYREPTSAEDALAYIRSLQIAITEVRRLLDAAKTRAAETGQGTDPRWFRRAEALRREIGGEVQRVERGLHALKAADHAELQREDRAHAKRFLRAALRLLDKATLARIEDLADTFDDEEDAR
jgi:capsule polysaccharide export protein KpsE/RkpR